jgi:hypothetical protein
LHHDVVDRYYDPVTGQFLSLDPKIEETGQAYLYAGDDPTDNVDPNGLFCMFGRNPNGSCRGAAYWRDLVDIPQDASYLQYWGAYEAIGAMQRAGSRFGPSGRMAANIVGLSLTPLEAVGLGGQALGSVVKGQSIWMQGEPDQPLLGNEVLGSFSGRRVSEELGLPLMRFPGFDYFTHHINF